MDNLYIFLSYESVNGGVNNLQVAQVATPSNVRSGLYDVLKTFTSKKEGEAFKKAELYVRKLTKNK